MEYKYQFRPLVTTTVILVLLWLDFSQGRCEEKSLERREEEAEVVISATVKDLRNDTHHPGMLMGEVEIKRVFKGGNVLNNNGLPHRTRVRRRIMKNRRIKIEGFGDPHICESIVRTSDTRIFLLNQISDGNLKLNSSVLRINMRNLDHASAVVKDIPYIPPPAEQHHASCHNHFCAFHGECYIDKVTATPSCRCPLLPCLDIQSPVCGDDRVTYQSQCHLERTSCKDQWRIKVKHTGECIGAAPVNGQWGDWSEWSACSVSCGAGMKRRFRECNNPAPSAGGRYCQDFFTEQKDCYVECDPCADYKCPYPTTCMVTSNKRDPTCQCHDRCPDQVNMVCGTNGHTYSNKCWLEREACRSQSDIKVFHAGRCKEDNPCKTMKCGYGEECRIDRWGKGHCECPPSCPLVVNRVCGTDNVSYDNECELRRQSCLNKTMVDIKHLGTCGGDHCSRKCTHGARCVIKNGREECICPHQCRDEYYEPVCGSDRKSYTNLCKLLEHNCTHKSNILKEHDGLCNGCGKQETCEHYSYCDRTGDRAKCICPTCDNSIQKVCGLDGKTYDNECKVRLASCLNSTFIAVAHDGECEKDPYNAMCTVRQCKYGEICSGNGHCVCPENCESSGKGLCASNGKWYRNKCEMMRDSCRQRVDLVITHYGRCDQVTVDCNEDVQCPETVHMVCANDGKTYMNECKMKKDMCRTGINLRIVDFGFCDNGTGSGSGSGSGSGDMEMDDEPIICDEEVNCRFGGKCVADGHNQHGVRCECNRNCPAVRQTVCGSDHKTYGSLCQLKEESCKHQLHIKEIELDNCNEMEELACDGLRPLVNPLTLTDYFCMEENHCPAQSYCHLNFNKCCREEFQNSPPVDCTITEYGCCPDGVTIATGTNMEGCDKGECFCSRFGSIDNTCHPVTNRCKCKPGVGGAKCDSCNPGYWNLISGNGCSRCDCNPYGTENGRIDCDQMTGQCLCRDGVSGLKCDQCFNGDYIGPDGCNLGVSIIGTCKELVCGFGARCQEIGGRAYCNCSALPVCHQRSAIVCGSDRRTYDSECALYKASCQLQKNLYMHYMGPCEEDKKTTPIHNGRHRKTTKNDGDNDITKSTERPNQTRPKKEDVIVKIKDRCLHGNYCSARHSECRQGICQCIPGYVSTSDLKDCVEVEVLIPDYQETGDSCSNNLCLNNGLCRPDVDLGYRCLCPIGTFNPYCKKNGRITTPSFSGMSQLILRQSVKMDHEIIIDISFKALNYDGLILYNSQFPDGTGDFLYLALRNGYVEFSFDVGGGHITLRNRKKIPLNRFVHVTASRDGKEGSLVVEKENPVIGHAPGALVSLNLDNPFYLGSAPNELTDENKARLPMGFVGCIKTIQMRNKIRTQLYDLSYPQVSDHIISGLDIGECGSNPCNHLPCKHGGTCLMKNSEVHSCICRKGFTGHNCDKVLDPCVLATCHDSSTCQVMGNLYKCICASNRQGEYCEYEKLEPVDIPQFTGLSNLELALGDIGSTSMSFTVWFKTFRPNGVLFYASHYAGGNGDFISVNIVNQRIEYRFNMGSGTVVILSDEVISLDTWHEVTIQKLKKLGTLLIDKNPLYNYTGESKGFLTELNLDNSILYVGGFSKFDKPVESNISHNFTGIIQRLYINGRNYDDLIKSARQTTNIVIYNGPPCNVNPCLNGGVCIPKMDQIECKCPAKFIGVKCEKRVDSINSDRPILFDGETVLQYNNEITHEVHTQVSSKFYIKFRTLKSSGLLLFQYQYPYFGDYIAIAIVNGHVEFSYNLGKQTSEDLFILKSKVDINDGDWHIIKAERYEREGELQVDEEPPIKGRSLVGLTRLDTTGVLYLGGKAVGHTNRYDEKFMGCIQEVRINDQLLHLVQHRTASSTIIFCES